MTQWSKPAIAGATSVVAAAFLLFSFKKNQSSTSQRLSSTQLGSAVEDGSKRQVPGSESVRPLSEGVGVASRGFLADKNNVRTEPRLHKNQLLIILKTISLQMRQLAMQLAYLEAKIRNEAVRLGRGIPEDMLASYLLDEFETSMKDIQTQVFAECQTTEDDVATASEYYNDENDPDIATVVRTMQDIYNVVTRSENDFPGDVTVEKFIPIMEELMESLIVTMEQVCVEVKELNPDDKSEAIRERYYKRADLVAAATSDKYGLTREALQVGLRKFMHEPTFVSAFAHRQQHQAERFAAAFAPLKKDINMDRQ